MSDSKKKRAEFFALDPVMIDGDRVEPGEKFSTDEATGFRLVGNKSAETPEMNEARGKANAAIKQARNAVRKAEQALEVAVKKANNPGKGKGKTEPPGKA